FAKFGELLRLDEAGNVIDKVRLNDKWRTLQPLVLCYGPQSAVALMRYSGPEEPHRVIQVTTRDGGQHWSEPFRSSLPNPDSAIAGTTLEDGRMLLVINNNPVRRDDLTMLVSEDTGQTWKEVFRFEDRRPLRNRKLSFGTFAKDIRQMLSRTETGFAVDDSRIERIAKIMCDPQSCHYQFDYPYLIRADDGHFHLLYTWNRTYIKHIEFNQTWLEAQIRDAGT
ncbi:MAG: exo-alpha-sialidase, partial [Gammaproteobacteria bacterium]